MLSGLVPSSSESDSDHDADSSQRDLGEGDEVGGVEDSQCAVRTTEKKNLGTVRPTLGVQQKLTDLRQERLRIAEKTEARRISALQKQAVKAVHSALNAEDQKVLKDSGIVLPGVRKRQRKRQHPDLKSEEAAGHHVHAASPPRATQSAARKGPSADDVRQQWAELKKYLDPNPQLRNTDQGRHAPKSGLEKDLDKAVEEGDFERAVDLSSHLAGREFAVKIAGAFDCLEYLKQKEVQETKGKGKRKKLQWSFDAKQRWETKSNM